MNTSDQYSKFINLITIVALFALTIFQIQHLSTLSSEIDDIGVYQSILKVKQQKYEIYKIIEKSSKPELIYEIKTRFGDQAEILALRLQKAHLLEPIIKFIANYRTFSSVPRAFTYAPGQYFITQFFINGKETYQTAKLKIRAVSKLFWFFGIIGILIILSKVRVQNINQASLLFLVLITCSESQTSYSAHGSNYAAGLFASSIVMLVIIHFFKSFRLSIPIILWLLAASLIQYQVIPLIFFIFAFSWLLFFLSKIFTIKKRTQSLASLFSSSLIFVIMFLFLVFPTFKKKIGNGLNWNVGRNKEYTLSDNYQSLFPEITFQKSLGLIIEPFKALIDTLASIYSPLPFSPLSANLIGWSLFALILFSFLKLSIKRTLLPFFVACFAIFSIHFLLYFFGIFPLSPTRHSLYLTSPLSVLCVISISHLITTLEFSYPKLTNPLFSIGVLFVLLAGGYLNVNYILNRADPFDQSKVLELLQSETTPNIILNSDWTYQHYAMPEVQKTKNLLNLNLHGGREKFRNRLDKVKSVIGGMKAGNIIHLMRVSHWAPDKRNSQAKEIMDIICKHFNYQCVFTGNKELFSSTKKASPEWVNNIQGFSNNLYINHLRITILNSTIRH
tara:strand:+ start:565 stop:2415 length:1851 start_codon:yes stop_codon:yes gene_type:complete